MKKLKYLLQLFDGIWSVPVTFLLFWLVGIILTGVFGSTAGTYDLGFLQPLFLAAAVVVGATNFGVLGVYFTLRGLHRYLYGQKTTGGIRVNFSRFDWRKITPVHRFLIALFVLFYFITAIIFVYLHFV